MVKSKCRKVKTVYYYYENSRLKCKLNKGEKRKQSLEVKYLSVKKPIVPKKKAKEVPKKLPDNYFLDLLLKSDKPKNFPKFKLNTKSSSNELDHFLDESEIIVSTINKPTENFNYTNVNISNINVF